MNKLETFVTHKCIKYCKMLKVDMPELIFEEKKYKLFEEYLESLYKDRYIPVKIGGDLRGASSLVQKTVFINVDSAHNQTLDAIEDTLIHELIHYTKPSYKHYTKRFKMCCTKLKQGRVKNGRFF